MRSKAKKNSTKAKIIEEKNLSNESHTRVRVMIDLKE
jgi:hypothetical protein